MVEVSDELFANDRCLRGGSENDGVSGQKGRDDGVDGDQVWVLSCQI